MSKAGETDSVTAARIEDPHIARWSPASLLSPSFPELQKSRFPRAVIVLNQPIVSKHVFSSVCKSAMYICFADGGANRVKSLEKEMTAEERRDVRPTALVGDLDSIDPEVQAYYQHLGAAVWQDPDQYSTDFQKSLRAVQLMWQDRSSEFAGGPARLQVVVFGGLGGRADQAFSVLHQFYAASKDHAHGIFTMYLVTPESIVFLLHAGRNLIETPLEPGLLGTHVGIIPLGRPAIISTSGLQWDVTDWPTEMGRQISTSNHLQSSSVEVNTTEPVLFTVEISPLLQTAFGNDSPNHELRRS